jgi:hypothetical protein
LIGRLKKKEREKKKKTNLGFLQRITTFIVLLWKCLSIDFPKFISQVSSTFHLNQGKAICYGIIQNP